MCVWGCVGVVNTYSMLHVHNPPPCGTSSGGFSGAAINPRATMSSRSMRLRIRISLRLCWDVWMDGVSFLEHTLRKSSCTQPNHTFGWQQPCPTVQVPL